MLQSQEFLHGVTMVQHGSGTRDLLSRSMYLSLTISRSGGLRFDASESRLFTWGADGTLRIWTPENHEGIRSTTRITWGAKPATRLILVRNEDNTAQFLDYKSGKPIGAALRRKLPALGATIDVSKDRILAWERDLMARLWSVETNEPIGEVLRHKFKVTGGLFDSSGTRVLTWSKDGTARLWNANSGEPIGMNLKHKGIVSGATFNSKGNHVLTWSQDGTARIWSAASGGPIGGALEHKRSILGAAFDPSGDRVSHVEPRRYCPDLERC